MRTPMGWKWIPGFSKKYAANRSGEIWSFFHDKWKKLKPKPAGSMCRYDKNKAYRQVCVKHPTGRVYRYVHHLIMLTFVGPMPRGKQCRHLDGCCTNNKLSNLSYGTREDDMRDRVRLNSQRGSNNGASKLNEKKVMQIKIELCRNVSQYVVANKFNVSQSTVSNIACGKSWSHV